jgi:heat shock protein beta
LAKAENGDGTGTGNLIGAFGLGFYSSFLVADRVYVASIPPKTAKTPNPVQHVFSSSADDSSYEIFPDPRGNTLGRGTEITLHLKEDSLEYLDTDKLTALVYVTTEFCNPDWLTDPNSNKHSSYSTTFPIYLFTQKTEEVPDEEAVEPPSETPSEEKSSETSEETPASTPEADKEEDAKDSDEAIVEDEVEEKKEAEPVPPKMKTVVIDEWAQLNALPPLWMRSVHAFSTCPRFSQVHSVIRRMSLTVILCHFHCDGMFMV